MKWLRNLVSDERVDEIALNSLKTIPARSAVAVGTGAVAAMNFGPLVGLGWLAAALLCEAWTWAVTQPHVRGAVGPAQRIHYLVSLVSAVLVWTLLGMYAWRTDEPMQQAAAVAIWTSQLLCAASFAFQTPRGFAVIAAPPGIAMLVAPFVAPNATVAQTITVFAMFVLCILYAVMTASQTAGFRRDLDRTQQSLRESEARAEASAQAKSEFLANMSHELRTPLTGIIGFADLLQQSAALGSVDQHRAALIHGAGATLLGVVNDVLDVSKMEAGALELDPHPFDLAAVVRDTAELSALQADAKGLWLRLDLPDAPLVLVGDSNRLRQVLLNLVNNALKFTTEGGVVVAVRAGPERRGMRPVRVEVRDTGIGVSADQQQLLFERFAQADGSISRKFGGTGLGLSISRRLIEMMRGRIGVDSVEGQGAAFWFEIDLPTHTGEIAAAPAAPRREDSSLSPLRVLIAEDHPVNRELLKALLEPYDLCLHMVTDGAQAVQAARTGAFDLILMDVQMPVMDGVTATQRIRALEGAVAAIPIVAMTANVFPDQIEAYRQAGMDGHIGKPIDPQALFDTLAAAADRGPG